MINFTKNGEPTDIVAGDIASAEAIIIDLLKSDPDNFYEIVVGYQNIIANKSLRVKALDTLSIKAAQAGLAPALLKLRRSTTVNSLLEMWVSTGETDIVIAGFDDIAGGAKAILDREIKVGFTIRDYIYSTLRSVV